MTSTFDITAIDRELDPTPTIQQRLHLEEIIEDHPDLERDDLLAALEFGALAASQRRVVPLGAA